MRREKKKLKKMSHYGRDVLLRWITDDGEVTAMLKHSSC
jgi:hypothetical protein